MKIDRLFEIIGNVLNIPVSEINESSDPKSIESWTSFKSYVLLTEIEKEFKINFTIDETLNISNVGDIINKLKIHGINFEN